MNRLLCFLFPKQITSLNAQLMRMYYPTQVEEKKSKISFQTDETETEKYK